MLEGLLVDYGNVLTWPQGARDIAAMVELLQRPPERFHQAYWDHRLAFDHGQPGERYWQNVLTALGCTDRADCIPELIEWDLRSWTHYREPLWEAVRQFRERGGRTAMLSNNVPPIMARLRSHKVLEEYFDAVVASCEVGCSKPDPAIYRMALECLDVPAEKTLFVDDRMTNIEAARQLGIQVLHFTRDEDLDVLTSLLSR